MAKKDTSVKDLISIFKTSMLEVSKGLHKPPIEIRRDEYIRYTIDNNLQRLHKDNLSDMGGYKYLIQSFFNNSAEQIKEEVQEEEQDHSTDIIEIFSKYILENKSTPTLKQLQESVDKLGFKVKIKNYFSSMEDILNATLQVNPEIKNSIFNESDFTEDYYNNVLKQIKNHKRFLITTAVANKKVNEDFLNCLKNFAKRNDALILVLPCEDMVNRRTESEWNLDPILKKDTLVIFKDTNLNNNLFISDIKVSAKMRLPLTGLSGLSKNKKSMIVSSPQQFLEFVPTSNSKLPVAIMSVGAITEEDYSSEFYMSKRLSKLAEASHTIGCVIVEIENEETFHFRHTQFLEGYFADLNTKYFSDGSISQVNNTVCVFGDSHIIVKDDDVHKEMCKLVAFANVKDIVLHDIFDGICVSPHTSTKPVIKAIDYLEHNSSIEKEGKEVVEYLNDVGTWIDGEVVVVYANHNTFLQRYLEDGRFLKDKENCYYSLDLVKALMEGKDPLQYMIEEKIGLSKEISVRWLSADEDYKKYGIQLGAHGSLGPNGSKGSAKNIEKCYEKSIIGHSHSPCIFRNVFQTGTLSKLKLSYNKGPSSWVNGSVLLHENGSRQIINFIKTENKCTWKL